MVATTDTIKINNFGGGLNFRDDELNLEIGETPKAQNIEIVRKTGLQKKAGYAPIFNKLPSNVNSAFADNYVDDDGNHHYVNVSYPDINLIDPITGAKNRIYSGLTFTGDPEGTEVNGSYILADEVNDPVIITKQTVTKINWPPSYTFKNNEAGNLDQSNAAVSDNPSESSIGKPGIVVFHANRIFLAGDKKNPRRIYASKIGDITNFSDNDPNEFDIAFFVDVPSQRPITAMKVVSNEYLVIYCDTEIILMTGEFPPGLNYPQPHFAFNTLNTSIGCLGKRLVAPKGDNDHFFVSNRGRIFQLTLTQNFQEVKPLGLTEKIFPLLAQYNNATFKRGQLINYQLRGELHFFLPSTNQRRYPDQDLILNYGDRNHSDVWSLDTGYVETTLIRSTLIDSESNKMILVTPREFLETNKGLNYNGAPIETIYQTYTLDFGHPNNNKEINNITIYARSVTGTKFSFLHTWESSDSGSEEVEIPANPDSFWGSADFGINDFYSSAGLPFQQKSFPIKNPMGKQLKIRIIHNSDDEDLTINAILIDFTLMGKD
ncbi:MAG: hypothetical protein HRT47_01445 [Candidatus Caenarcaniphilales bacterium]|nr:hypothetical protein [Candidatus Caenarcaniphilales bacterium]